MGSAAQRGVSLFHPLPRCSRRVRLKNKYDTRAAAAVERIAKQGTKLIQQVSSDQGIEALLFGTGGEREARQVKDGEEIFDRGLFALFDEWKIRSGDDESRKEHGAAAAAPAAGGGDGKQGKGPLSSNIKPFQHQQQQQQQHTSKEHQQPPIPPQRAGGKIAPWERQSDDSLASLNLEVAEINRARNPYMERNPYREGTEAAAKWDRKDADSATPSDVDSHTTSENEGATGMGTGTGTAPGAVGKIDITGALLSALVESSGDRGLPLDAPSATHQPPPPPSTSLPEETDASHPRKRVSLAVDGDDRDHETSPYYVADSPSPSTAAAAAADAEQRQRAHIQVPLTPHALPPICPYLGPYLCPYLRTSRPSRRPTASTKWCGAGGPQTPRPAATRTRCRPRRPPTASNPSRRP